MTKTTAVTPHIFTKYPACRYHKDLAPKGRTIHSAAEEAELGDGWVDTPAAFAPDYVRLTEDPPEGTEFQQYVVPAAPPVPYPAMRYPRDGGEPVTVQTLEQDHALGPDYQDHPWTKAALAEGRPTTTATDTVPVTIEHVAPLVDDEPKPPASPAPNGDQPDSLWRVTVAQAKEVIAEISDPVELADIAAREQRNPNGARKGILAAIDARQNALAVV